MGTRSIYGMELCAGIAGLGLGIHRAIPAYRTVVAAEIEAYCVAVLAARQQDGSLPPFPVWDDLTTFDGAAWRGVVDIVAAGYPCQPFSLAGRRLGEDDPRHLWPHVARILGDVRAPLVFLENVSAHLGLGFRGVGEDLQRLGYRFEVGVFRASDVGAPHKRERMFILGWRPECMGNPERQSLALGGRLSGHDGAECPPAERAGDTLADTTMGRWGPSERDADAGQPDAARRGAALADAAWIQRPGQGRGLRHGGRVREVPQAVGDAERECCERRRVSGDVAGTSADPEGEAHERERGRCPALDHGSGVWPGFPPGPDDRDGWLGFLECYPGLAPATERAVRRGADGPSVRVDRLRALGNAVVPQQAAAALRILWWRAFGEWPS